MAPKKAQVGRPPKQAKPKASPAAPAGAQLAKGKPKVAKAKVKNQPVQAVTNPIVPAEEEIVPPEEEYDTDRLAELPTDSEAESDDDQMKGSSSEPDQ